MADVVAKFKLEDGSELPIGKSFISSLKSVSESTTDAGSINYGTLANTGSISIQDGNGYISKMIDDGILPVSDLDVNIEVDGEIFQQHITTDSDYNTEDNTLNVSLSNFVKDFDILKYKGYPYPDSSRSLYDLFFDVLNSYFKTTKDVIDAMFDDDVLEYIKEISVEYPVIEYGKTYRKILDELCTIAQINMFATKENSLRFMSARPVYTLDENIKNLNWGNIVEDLKYTKTLKNKFDGVEMSLAKVIDSNKYNTAIDKITIDTSTLVDDDLFTRGSGGGGGHMVLVNDIGYSYTWYAGAVYSYVWGDYADYDKKFVKKIKNNLEQILSVSNKMFSDEEKKYPNFKIFYKKAEKATTGTFNLTGMTLDFLNLVNWEYKDFTDSDFENVDVETGYDLTQETKINYNDPYGTEMTISQTAKIEDLSEMTVSDIGDRFELEIEAILCGFQKLSLSFLGGTNNFESVTATGTVTKYKPIRVELTLYGDKRVIEFEESPDSSDDIENKKTKASVQSSNLLQQGTLYKNESQISSIIKQNILSDYRMGISEGGLVLNDNIVEIGDLIKYPNDRRVWRVVGKEFNYDGEYLFHISVMQCLTPHVDYGLYNDEILSIKWAELVSLGKVSIENSVFISQSILASDGNRLLIEDTVSELGKDLFRDSSVIKSVELPNSITKINDYAFAYCSNLEEINIPSSVNSLGKWVFNQCSSLKNIYLSSNVNMGSMVFYNNTMATIYTNLDNLVEFDSIYENASIYDCVMRSENNVIYLVPTSSNFLPYADVFNGTLDAGDWTYSCGSNSKMALTVVIDGVEQPYEYISSGTYVKTFNLSKSSNVILRLIGVTNGEAMFLNITLTSGKSDEKKNALCNQAFNWNLIGANPISFVPVKYGYTYKKYKEEISKE